MGGQISEVSDSTTRILMEAATWVGPNIMRTSRALGLRSEASARFEKQLHPEQAIAAQRLAARLMVELAGARLVPGTIDVYPNPAQPRIVPLRKERMERLLGQLPPDDAVDGILGRLGFEWAGEGWRVPPWRDSDVQREADLIEEVARVYGLDKLPTTLPARKDAIGRLTPGQRLRRRLEDVLRDRGLLEAIAYSFTSPGALADLRLGDVPVLRVENPLSEDQSVLRPLLLPGLLDAAKRNAAHGRPGVALFESAHVYAPDAAADTAAGGSSRDGGDGAAGSSAAGAARPAGASADSPGGRTPARERQHLAALITEASPAGWRSEARPGDFFSAKALVETVLESAGVVWRADPSPRPFLHPGRAAAIVSPGAELTIGWVGELHPLVAEAWELPRSVAAFELDVDAVLELAAGHVATHSDVTTFPAVLQDIAVVIAEDVTAAAVEGAVRAGGGKLLRSVRVFDLYRGEQVGEGSKSLALRLEFRARDRTLTDDDVLKRRTAIEAKLAEIGGKLRA
jgi:phenylalanyl-tRNA synthetase beta chain